MTKILLANSYFYRLDKKQWRFKQPYPPLATIIAAAVLRTGGFSVALFDTSLKRSPLEIIPELDTHQPELFVMYDDGFNYLSKMCLTQMRDAAFVMIREARNRNATVIVSSSDATDHSEKYLQAGANFILRGEAEETLLELIMHLDGGRDVQNIHGLIFRKNNEIKSTPRRTVLRNLDELPLPAWDLVRMDDYRRIWVRHHGYFSLNIATTRGCPYKCNWCAKPIYGNRYNSRSPEHVIDEIELLMLKHGAAHFWMCDDIFGLKPGWIQQFNRIVGEKRLRFKYKIQSRVDLLLEPETIQSLAESGAETVWVGAESGSQKILDAMDKGITIHQIHSATALLREKKIRVALFLQLGYLGEQKEDIDLTIKMLLDILPDEVGISVSYPLPGTKFYEKVKHQLKEKQNWTNSDDLAMMFQNTLHTDYYKRLHRYVHSLYRSKKALVRLRNVVARPMELSRNDLKSFLSVIYFSGKALLLRRTLSKIGWHESEIKTAEMTM